ncbi:unnamed protein product [Brassica napus]|uniref:(rape) hypothetical protein n=1 Tax=Brassica napus TaxID=3708 RepID=A0A816I778_BRANA|nr:unnamed protein product [Brassica napus]
MAYPSSSCAPLPPSKNPPLETLSKSTCNGFCYILKDNMDTNQIIPADKACIFPSNQKEPEEIGCNPLSYLPNSQKPRLVDPGEIISKYSI